MSVYEPREDSFLLSDCVKRYSKGKSVLDMCSGSGILAQTAIDNNALAVTAVDINNECIKLCKTKGINAIKSNLFSKVKGKFDLIICNPPYLPQDERESEDSALATSGGKKGDELICKFISQVVKHLEKQGKILLLVSSLTPMKQFNLLLKKLKFKSEIVSKKKLSFEELFVLLIER